MTPICICSQVIIHLFSRIVKRKPEKEKPEKENERFTQIKKPPDLGWFFEYNYLYFLLRAASDFFLRLTLGFS